MTGARHVFSACLALALTAPPLPAQSPPPGRIPDVGEVQKLKVITVSMKVGSTTRQSRQVTYTPPPGWYVRSHAVHCAVNTGHCSFSVATVPQDWRWLSEEKVQDSYRALLEAAAPAPGPASTLADLKARLHAERDARLDELRRARSTHHALVLDAVAQGEGLFRGGGALELSVEAELVYLGTDETYPRPSAPRRTTAPPPPVPAGVSLLLPRVVPASP